MDLSRLRSSQPPLAVPETPQRQGLVKLLDLASMFGAPRSALQQDAPLPGAASAPAALRKGAPGAVGEGLRLDTESGTSQV